MVLVYLKALLLPPRSGDGYQYSPVTDVEKDQAQPSSSQRDGEEPTRRIPARIISDATIGLSDGLTVPFALTAGLSALGQSRVVIFAGLAELIAGSISMGLGGYLGARSERQAYLARLAETKTIVEQESSKARSMVKDAFGEFDLGDGFLDQTIGLLSSNDEKMVKFLMRFVHGLGDDGADGGRAYVSGLTISGGYVGGGLIALLPYLVFNSVSTAFIGSVVFMAVALFAFGWTKTTLVGELDRAICFRNGLQMLVLGGIAAGAAMACVKAVGT